MIKLVVSMLSVLFSVKEEAPVQKTDGHLPPWLATLYVKDSKGNLVPKHNDCAGEDALYGGGNTRFAQKSGWGK
jgi:hypothetical protein